MVFNAIKEKNCNVRSLKLGSEPIQYVTSFKYLGYIIRNNLKDSDDIDNARNKFYREFNCLLRKFHFVNKEVLIYLLKQYCFQTYGAELWMGNSKSTESFKQFAIGYHKAIKKILKVSTHESNHFVCQEAGVFTFEHFVNKQKILAGIRFMSARCDFVWKAKSFLTISSFHFKDIYDILFNTYSIESLTQNDRDALISRIAYVQNHESQSRLNWD